MTADSIPPPLSPPTPLAQLHSILQSNDVASLPNLPSLEVPADLLPTLLTHPLQAFRDWVWQFGGSQVVEVAMSVLWRDRSTQLALDFTSRLGAQAFYESYFYQTAAEFNLSHIDFLWEMAPSIGYPNLKWAVTSTSELLNLALQNPQLETRYIQRVQRWAASSPESTIEADTLQEVITQRELLTSVAVQ